MTHHQSYRNKKSLQSGPHTHELSATTSAKAIRLTREQRQSMQTEEKVWAWRRRQNMGVGQERKQHQLETGPWIAAGRVDYAGWWREVGGGTGDDGCSRMSICRDEDLKSHSEEQFFLKNREALKSYEHGYILKSNLWWLSDLSL